MIKLPRRSSVFILVECVGDGLVVSENDELSGFQHMMEMSHGFVDYHQFSVISAVFVLHWAELHGEESEGLPGILHAVLQYGCHGKC